MKINFIKTDEKILSDLYPVTCGRELGKCPVGGINLNEALIERIAPVSQKTEFIISISERLWPSLKLIKSLVESEKETIVVDEKSGTEVFWLSKDGEKNSSSKKIPLDSDSILISYPWDLLKINEEIIGALDEDIIEGEIRNGVNIDGHIIIGEGTILLPGVYIEGNVVIGKNCKIGPNCYIRGNTSIGNGCHLGQAVEIKNSIIMNKVSIGHLSYIGDSIICTGTNLGAGTITANLRHDGKKHKSTINGTLVDTGRRKLGVIAGDNVHTGIHTSIYPGRKIWPNMSTRPGEIVQKDIRP